MAEKNTTDDKQFRRIEAWSMRELGFSFKEIGKEFGIVPQSAYYLVKEAIKKNEVPPSEEYCEDIAPKYAEMRMRTIGTLAN